MGDIDKITRESWILNSYPEWGTWLNEEIDGEVVKPGTFAMWWLGCVGVWVKTPESTNIVVDLWCGNGKRTQKVKDMAPGHQMANMCGCRKLQPNLRAAPMVIDPFAVTNLDAVLATHYHSDHIDPNFAAAVIRNIEKPVPFIGPSEAVKRWISWGVPESRCKVVKPGDVVKIQETEILALESFDRTCLVTTPGYVDIRGTCPDSMDKKAVNYLIKTTGGSLYHSGDSHYSIMYAKHGKEHQIDVALGSYGENPVGIQDKMTSIDILRMGEALRCKVVIPVHYDVWTNFMADPKEISVLWEMRRHRLQYEFEPFIWEVGGKYVYPEDLGKREYHHRRGFEDCFSQEPNVPFPSIL